MENPVQLQLLQGLVFLSAGIAAGLVYDVCRAIRRCCGRVLQALADVGFVVLVSMGLFVLGMAVGGGALRGFMVGCAAVGGVGYSCLCSRYTVPIFCFIVGFVRNALIKIKKFIKIGKNVFPNRSAWFKMVGCRFSLRRHKSKPDP